MLPDNPKIVTQDDLARKLRLMRHLGHKIVFTNGCFDLLHPGHVDLLARARNLGDFLIVGLNTDESVRKLGKGPERPLNPFEVRAFMLAHLAAVDLVIGFTEDTPQNLIAAIRPDVLVKGGDYLPGQIVGRETVEAAGGLVLALPLLDQWSSTALLDRIAKAGRQPTSQGA